ncbi:MAG: F0F1 ATP synthase subunit epsilon [Nitrospiraceae bacterium]|nr:F0F1 ATP synthase subunit epsilon [Nitrospiraceae bacterium]
MDKLALDIVTPHGTVYSGPVEQVDASGADGDFGVLAGHAPLMAILRIGALIIKADGKPSYYFVGSGYAEVLAGKMIVLAESAEKAEDIDVERAMEKKKRLELLLAKKENVDFTRAQAALERAIARIRIAKEYAGK